MNIFDYADSLGLHIVIHRFAGRRTYVAQFDHVLVKDGGTLGSAFGIGLTTDAAVANYAKQISGKRIQDVDGSVHDVPMLA